MELRRPDLDDFAATWRWLREHPAFFYAGELAGRNEPGFEENLDITVTKDSGQAEVWLEAGGWTDDETGSEAHRLKGVPCHDPDLDSGGETFEDAVKALARRVLAKHGDYPAYRVCSHCLRNLPAGATDPEAEWFCSESCAACGRVEFRTEPVPGKTTRRGVGPDEQFECEHYPRPAKTPRRSSDERLALAYLAALAATHPHVNTDGETVGLPDEAPGAWCLGCTVQAVAQTLDLPSVVREDGEADPEAVAAAEAAWSDRADMLAASESPQRAN